MSEQSPNPSTNPQPPKRRLRSGLILAGVALAGGLMGAFTTKAVSHGFGRHFTGGYGFMHMRGDMTTEKAQKQAERMAKHFAVEIDATPDQQARLATIANAVASDVFPLRQKLRDARKKAVDLLTSPTVDRTAVEALRAEQFANIDAISKRVSAAMTDAAEILTPDQRKMLEERVSEWRERRGKRGHRGWRGWRHHDRGESLDGARDRG